MRITFIIGNGFDLALGLNTSYSSFLVSYLDKLKHSNKVHLSWFQRCIATNARLWSDAEKAFGEMIFDEPEFVDGDEKILAFSQCLQDFKTNFIDYLLDANRYFNDKLPEINSCGDEFCAGIFGLGQYLRPQYRKEFENAISSQPVYLNFISLNYTETLEKLIASFAYNNQTFKSVLNGRSITARLERPCIYLHGSLKEDRIVFGVDNDSQIRDGVIRKHCKESKRLVKSFLDMGYGLEIEAKMIMRRSDWLVPMGVSFGDTDKKLWSELFDCVFRANRSKLLLLPYYKESDVAAQVDENDRIFGNVRKAFSSLATDPAFKDFDALIANSTMDRVRVCKPSIVHGVHGESAYSDFLHLAIIGKKVGLRKTAKEIIEAKLADRKIRHDTMMFSGTVSFDYKENGGEFVFSVRGNEFVSKWSDATANSVRAYRDGVERIGFLESMQDLPPTLPDVKLLNWGRRDVVVKEGDVIFLLNKSGRILGLKILFVSAGVSLMNAGRIDIEYRLFDE